MRAFRELQEREGHTKPQVSAWLTGLKETVEELPAFVKLAAEIGVKEVYLQRLVFFDQISHWQSTAGSGAVRAPDARRGDLSQACRGSRALAWHHLQRVGRGVRARPELEKTDEGSPWSLCRRPWSLMYFTANGRALPCCIAPFSQHGYDNYTLGDATQQTLRDIWNGQAYREFRTALLSDKPPAACANCGLRWSL